jgi:hypothetical protein
MHKMDLYDMKCHIVDWSHVAQDTDKSRSPVDMIMNLPIFRRQSIG